MAESLEPIVSVRVANARVVNAAEWQIAVQKLHQGVSDTGATRCGIGEHLVDIAIGLQRRLAGS
jgi:hypothetical protein